MSTANKTNNIDWYQIIYDVIGIKDFISISPNKKITNFAIKSANDAKIDMYVKLNNGEGELFKTNSSYIFGNIFDSVNGISGFQVDIVSLGNNPNVIIEYIIL